MNNHSGPFPALDIPEKFSKSRSNGQNKKIALQAYEDFFSFPINRARREIEQSTPEHWELAGQRMALNLFHATAKRVPAYKGFLKKHKVSAAKIKTFADFAQVPPIDKDNYLSKYSLADLSWDGVLTSSQIISVSSGSSGSPFFWPRGIRLELETTLIFELLLDSFFHTDERSTLFIDAFAMGMYVGGPITLNSVLRVAQKGHRITIVTPGYSLDDIIRVVKELGPQHDQVIIASYPPFAKDIIDEGNQQQVPWARYKLKLLLAGEGFNESWRDYIAEKGGKLNPYQDIINIYGTADAAILGHETPTSIAFRRAFDDTPGFIKTALGAERLPSMLQYYPTLRYFEMLDDELHFTASAGVPLIRYNIKDTGGLISFDQMERYGVQVGLNLTDTLQKQTGSKPWKLPFVYVYGRSDHTSVLYGANIYPENIKSALEQPSMRDKVTGKFIMFTDTDHKQNQHLYVHIECANGTRPSSRLKRQLQTELVKTLIELNSEFRFSYKSSKQKINPIVHLYKHGDLKSFNQENRVKHRWTIE
ncbi:phenylacetate--CoA ligase family protein [Patescibacteria group bacterium]|nr:phenylacetate--CoA ligase family protein [Patescibacteria group bacterium]